MSGFKTGRLTVTDVFEIRKEVDKHGVQKSCTYWKCICECGNYSYVSTRRLRTGQTKSCGCLLYDYQHKIHALPKNQSSKNYLFYVYKQTAKKRNISFKLNKDQFESLISEDCLYCGTHPNTIKKIRNSIFLYNGIDRVDNTCGYEPDNCVPCCKVCNRSKSDMTKEEFLAWVSRIYKHELEATKGDSG
jgi:hypothetical protein